jgi:hypothetical protein
MYDKSDDIENSGTGNEGTNDRPTGDQTQTTGDVAVTPDRQPRDDMPDLSQFNGFENREVIKESGSSRYITGAIDGERYVAKVDLDSGAVTVNQLGPVDEIVVQESQHSPQSASTTSVEKVNEGVEIITRSTEYIYPRVGQCAASDCRYHETWGMSAELNKHLAGVSKALIAVALIEALAATSIGSSIFGVFSREVALKGFKAALSGYTTSFLEGNTVSAGNCMYDLDYWFGVQKMQYFGIGFGPWKPKCNALLAYVFGPGHLSSSLDC